MAKGQSLVEFAVSLVVLLILLSGLIEFGIIFFQYVQLRDAAQEGVLFGSACDCSVSEITERAVNASDTPINLKENTRVSVTVADQLGNLKNPDFACEGDSMTVMLSFDHRIFMPFLPQMLGVDYITLNASVVDTVLIPLCT